MPTPRTLSEAAAALRRGQLSSVELTRALLARADRLDARLGVYLTRFDETALAAAARADAELASGVDRGPLHGIPLGIKDILTCSEGPTTAQSLVMDPEWGGRRDAPVVARLRAAGAVITGKTTTNEFACGLPDPGKPFPIPRNPWDTSRWTGGSSAGSGGGVAAGLFLGGIGSDTAGSIRIPAAFCGISGLKPTFGLVPRAGCVPLATSFDHIGPMARSALDCALLLSAIAGPHPEDRSSVPAAAPPAPAALDAGVSGLRVGVARPHRDMALADPALGPLFEAALGVWRRAGAELVEVEIPLYRELTDATFIGSAAESFAQHARDLAARWSEYGAPTRMSLAAGGLYSVRDYLTAQRVRERGRRAMARLFRHVDVVVTPTAAVVAPPVDALDLSSVVEALFTFVWNGVGLPALSLPMGFNAEGLPLALQIAGRAFEEATVLGAGIAYQSATDWHLREPSGAAGAAKAPAPRAVPAPLPADLARVRMLLESAGVRPDAEELAGLASAHPGMRAAADRLHGTIRELDHEPALRYDLRP